ncbi:MAG: 6-carboxytetrahydropterin synthase QueD, partial [Coprococcus catus]|nr:6-carboxytetrahydropterin synthase QueD [Coprococcus catus]
AYYFYERLTACGYHVHRSTVYETPNNCASYEE